MNEIKNNNLLDVVILWNADHYQNKIDLLQLKTQISETSKIKTLWCFIFDKKYEEIELEEEIESMIWNICKNCDDNNRKWKKIYANLNLDNSEKLKKWLEEIKYTFNIKSIKQIK